MTDVSGLNADQKEHCLTQTGILQSVCRGEMPAHVGMSQQRKLTVFLAQHAAPDFAEVMSEVWALALAPRIVEDAKKAAAMSASRPAMRRHSRKAPQNG